MAIADKIRCGKRVTLTCDAFLKRISRAVDKC